MEIIILGIGCPTCTELYTKVGEVVTDLGIRADLKKIEDLETILSYGVMSVPALVINGKLIFAGKNPNKEEIKGYLLAEAKATMKCACNGNCD